MYADLAPNLVNLDNGSCAPTANDIVEPASFDFAHRVCGFGTPQQGGCDAGDVCAPTAGGDDRVCVWSDGELDCPAAFADRLVTYTTLSDGKGCTACTCQPAQGSCTATVRVGETCNAIDATLSDGDCYDTEDDLSWFSLAYQREVTCPSAVTEPTGEVVPQGARTFCCL
jgi:hypothetical protein